MIYIFLSAIQLLQVVIHRFRSMLSIEYRWRLLVGHYIGAESRVRPNSSPMKLLYEKNFRHLPTSCIGQTFSLLADAMMFQRSAMKIIDNHSSYPRLRNDNIVSEASLTLRQKGMQNLLSYISTIVSSSQLMPLH